MNGITHSLEMMELQEYALLTLITLQLPYKNICNLVQLQNKHILSSNCNSRNVPDSPHSISIVQAEHAHELLSFRTLH